MIPRKTIGSKGGGFCCESSIHARAKNHHVQRQIRKKYVGMLRKRRSVVWGMRLSVLVFWLIAPNASLIAASETHYVLSSTILIPRQYALF